MRYLAALSGWAFSPVWKAARSEEHTSELQSPQNLVCRLLLEKNKKVDRHSDDVQLTRHPGEGQFTHTSAQRRAIKSANRQALRLSSRARIRLLFFFFNDAAPPEIYTLPLPAAFPT